jgi:hypothetical protein
MLNCKIAAFRDWGYVPGATQRAKLGAQPRYGVRAGLALSELVKLS